MFSNQYYELAKAHHDQLLHEAEQWRKTRNAHLNPAHSQFYRFIQSLGMGSSKILRNRNSMRLLSAVGMGLSTS